VCRSYQEDGFLMQVKNLCLIPLFFCLFLSLFGNLFTISGVTRKDFVSLSIAIDTDSGFDDLNTHLTALDFHNFTFIIWYNSAWAYILVNSTRVNILKSFGVLIPMASYMQMYEPIDRKNWVDSAFADFNTYVGYYPKGFMSFVPDTYTVRYAYDAYNCTYVQGYCFDQYTVDFMTMRGGWQLPYYSSFSHVLKPSDSKGLVIFPHITWDWIDSLTLSHYYNTHIQNLMLAFGSNVALAKTYWLNLIDRSLTGCSPFGFASVQWEWAWMSSFGYQDYVFAWFTTLLQNPLYTFWTYQDVAEWFLTNYDSNPVYHVSFASPHSGSSVEWYWSTQKRVCRVGGVVMSYVDYTVPCNDKYRTGIQGISWGEGWENNPDNCVDITLYNCIKIDALGGGDLRFEGVGDGQVYSGDLANFGGASPSYYPSIATYTIKTDGVYSWVVASNSAIFSNSTNSTVTIQWAFDNLPDIGGKVFLSSGLYTIRGIYITNKISVSDYPQQEIIFEGEGRYISTLKLEDNSTGVVSAYGDPFPAIIYVESSTDLEAVRVTIRQIGIDGNRLNQEHNIAGICLHNDWESVMEDNYFFMCGGHGIAILGGRHLRGTYINRNTVYFTDMYGNPPVSIPSDNALEYYLAAIAVWKQDVTVYDNIVGWTGETATLDFRGIGICGFVGSRIQRNWLWGHRYGIVVSNGLFFTVSNNFLDTSKDVGIFLFNSHSGSITNNDVRVGFHEEAGGKSEACIELAGTSSFNVVMNNMVWVNWIEGHPDYTSRYGIREKDTCDYNTIVDNNIVKDAHVFTSGSLPNEVGSIDTPISTVGTHTVVADNYGFTSETPPSEPSPSYWYQNPLTFGIIILGLCVGLWILWKIKASSESLKKRIEKV